MMNIAKYLGKPVSVLLGDVPYKEWSVERSVEDQLETPRIYYLFRNNGLEVRCDSHEIIRVMFLYAKRHGGFSDADNDVPFSLTREQILKLYGTPSKRGEKSQHPILGASGAWDRFTLADFTIHFEYGVEADEIAMITLMQNNFVP